MQGFGADGVVFAISERLYATQNKTVSFVVIQVMENVTNYV